MDNVPMVQENEVVKFFREKGNFLSEEGKELINRVADSVINEAAYENSDIMDNLLKATSYFSKDPCIRRKIIKAL